MRNRKDFISKTYQRGVKVCLEKHPQLFYEILVYGKGKNKSGPPCDPCRLQAIREAKRQEKKEGQPWLRKPRNSSPRNSD